MQPRYRILFSLLVVGIVLSVSFSSAKAELFIVDSSDVQPSPVACLIYAVDQKGDDDAQLFAINLRTKAIQVLGSLAGYDLEGVAVHPKTHVLYATASEHGAPPSNLFNVDAQTGALTLIGNTGFGDVADLAFRPTDATLWGWVENEGLIQIDLATGVGALQVANTQKIDGITWNNEGTLLYGASGKKLWVYDLGTGELKQIADNLPRETTSLEMRPDGLLLGGANEENSVDIFAYDSSDSRIAMLTSVDDSRYDPDDIAWPPICGNASPGGQADMIKEVVIEKEQVCAGEDFLLTVQVTHPEASQKNVDVMMNGKWGNQQYLQFEGIPGPRLIEITASTPEHYIDSRQVQVEVIECDASQQFPVVNVRSNLYHEFVVDFEVVNATEFSNQNPVYIWNFGDGQTTQTTVPFTTHFYGNSITRDQQHIVFQATLTLQRNGYEDVSTQKTVTFWNLYAFNRQLGFIQPPVQSSGQMQLDGTNLVGEYTIKNLEDEPVQLTTRQLEYQFCDPEQHSILLEPEGQNITIGGLQELTQQIELPADSLSTEVCGLEIYLDGQTPSNFKVHVDVHFELRNNARMTKQVQDAAFVSLLNSIVEQKLVDNTERITDEDLYRLAGEGKIVYPTQPPADSVANIASAILQDDQRSDVIGQPCVPGDTLPRDGVSCQVTNEWAYTPAYIANAKKGDILLTAACGAIGKMFRHLSPPQYYTHEGMMTQDRYEVRHSTLTQERLGDYRVGVEGSAGIRPDVLKYGWPGPITQAIYKAFEGEYFYDPESGKAYLMTGFGRDNVGCQGDIVLTPPLVLKPHHEFEGTTRPKLHAAAEAAKQLNGHYRNFAYSEGAIAHNQAYNGPPEAGWANGTRATVSTVFVWAALKDAGITLEGEFDLEDYAQRPTWDCQPVDGLYCYDELERQAAGKALYAEIYNKARNQVPGWIEDLIPIVGAEVADLLADMFAQQVVNCFAFDLCETLTPLVDPNWNLWEHPGPGESVSPDNFKLWDSPSKGGVYGYWVPLNYITGKYQRVYRWLPSGEAGNVTVRVYYEGLPLQDTTVMMAGFTQLTNPAGETTFEAIPAGTYEVNAIKEIAPGEIATAKQDVAVIAQETVIVNLNLGFDLPPQPTVTIRVTIERLHAFGCWGEWIDPPFFPGFCLAPETPDFYALIGIDKNEFGNEGGDIEGDDIFPNWEFSSQVDSSRANIPLKIEIRDEDDFLRWGDDHADINPNKGRNVDMLVDLNTCTVSGDAIGACGEQLYSLGGKDGHEDLAEIWFRIEIVTSLNDQSMTTVTSITPSGGGRLTTTSDNLSVRFPANAVTSPVSVIYKRLQASSQVLGQRRSAPHSFTLEAQSSNGSTMAWFSQPYTLTISYTEEQLATLDVAESSLNLVFWDGNTWVDVLPCPGCSMDTSNNQVTVLMDHIGEFALVGNTVGDKGHNIFLPMIER